MTDFVQFPPPNGITTEPERFLSQEQEDKYGKVLEHFTADGYLLPVNEEKSALTEEEKFWLTKDCLHRYLRASKWVLATAIQRLEDTMKWRREFGLYDVITAEHVEPEGLTGKEIIFGYDTAERPGLLLIPSRQNTKESPRQLHFLVWMLERCIDLMGPGVEMLTLLINYADRGASPSFSTSRAALNIIQSHYPERLGRALIINLPFMIHTFYKMISPFIDPHTRQKLKFNPDTINDGLFTADNLMKEWWGGSREFEWSQEKYWPSLVTMCEGRREGQGGSIGLSEWDVKIKALGGKVSSSDPNGEKISSIEHTVSVDNSNSVTISEPVAA